MDVVDAHCHIISEDLTGYPKAPIGGKQSAWAATRPVTAEGMISRMVETGIDQAVLVQATTNYGYDNSYVIDGNAAPAGSLHRRRYGRPAAAGRGREPQGSGRRRRSGGRPPVHQRQHRTHTGGVVRRAGDVPLLGAGRGTGSAGLPPDAPGTGHRTTGGAPGAVPRCEGAPRPHRLPRHRRLARPHAAPRSRHWPSTPASTSNSPTGTWSGCRTAGERAGDFLGPVVDAFGAERIAWGSNCPAAEQSLPELLTLAQDVLQGLPERDRQEIFAGTARRLYPSLGGHGS